MTTLHSITFDSLAAFPQALERHYAAFPRELVHWTPDSWEGVPSEPFTAIEQVCHVRDIEIEGYQVRIRRTLAEDSPFLPSIDSEPIAKERHYGAADVAQVFASFRVARAETIATLRSLDAASFDRPAEFEGYGPVTLRGLVHFLCSHDQQHLSGLQWLLGKIARAA
jgi:hypothetical protein